MSEATFDRDDIDWDAPPAEPIVQWQARDPAISPGEAVVGAATVLVFSAAAFALGLWISQRLRD
jgi:hypothetical protein